MHCTVNLSHCAYLIHCKDFNPNRAAFFLFFGLKAASALVILAVKLDFRMPSNQVTKDVKVLLKNPEVITLMMVMLITGEKKLST